MLGNVALHLVETFEDAAHCIEWIEGSTSERIGFDCETTGLSPETDRVRLVQFGDQDQGWALPFDRWSGLVAEIVNRWQRHGRFVGHNARFDVAMLDAHGIHIPKHLVDDTRFLAHIVDPTVSVALKAQSARHVDPQAAAMQSQLDAVMHAGGWTWETIPITSTGPLAVYWIYGALDPVLTMRLWDVLYPIVEREAPKAYDLELATGWIANAMERRGVVVDRQFTADQHRELEAEFHTLSDRARSEFGVNPGSKDAVVDVLIRDGVDLWKRTDNGAFSLDKEVLASVDHPLLQIIARRRRIEKLRSTYLRRFLEYSAHDGRLHPRINTIGGSGKSESESGGEFAVKTARMSMERPNLQQLPRRADDDPSTTAIRNCITASAPDRTLIMPDFDQIEARIMAHLSGDPGLAAAFASEADFFTTLTRQIFDDPMIVKSDPRRQLTKSYVYATLYGAGNDKLATTTGVSLSVVEQLSADFGRTYAGVPAFQRTIQQRAWQRFRDEGSAYVRSPLTGRKFIASDAQSLYQLVNYIIQGMAAEVFKTKLLELDAAGLGDVLVLPVHDEVIADVADEDIEDAIATMREVMNDANMLTVPLTSGVAIGKRWGEKQDV